MAKRPIRATGHEEAWGYRTPWYRVMNFFQKRVGQGKDLRAKLLSKKETKVTSEKQVK